MQKSNENKQNSGQEVPKVVSQATARLVSNPDLNIVLTWIKKDYILRLVNTAPDEQQLREECYSKHMALEDFELWVNELAKQVKNG